MEGDETGGWIDLQPFYRLNIAFLWTGMVQSFSERKGPMVPKIKHPSNFFDVWISFYLLQIQLSFYSTVNIAEKMGLCYFYD